MHMACKNAFFVWTKIFIIIIRILCLKNFNFFIEVYVCMCARLVYLLYFIILGSPMISSSCAIPTQVSVFGNNVSLSCPVSSNPLPVIQWFKDGVPISSSLSPSSYSLDDDNMTLLLFTPPPSRSSYTCRAVNSLGNDSSTLILSIEGMSLLCLSI